MKAQRRAHGASSRFWAATAGAIALLTLGIAAPAHAATETVANPSSGLTMCSLDPASSYGQWFISPTDVDGELTEVGFYVTNTKVEYDAQLTISSGIGNAGQVIHTQPITVPLAESETLVTYDLLAAVPVTPGGTYSFEVDVTSQCPFDLSGGEPFGEGTLLFNGEQRTGDLGFTLTFETPDGTPATIAGQPTAGVVGTAYTYAFAVGGAPAPTVTHSGGTLPPGLTLDNAGVLSGTPTAAGTYTFTVSAGNPSGVSAITVTMQVNPAMKPKADVALSLSAPAKATRNSTFTYTATVRNHGPSTAESVTTDLALPPGVTFVSASAQVKRVGNLVSWKVDGLQNGQSQQLTVTVKATKTGPQLAGAGALRLGTPDPKLINNVAAALTTVK